MKKKKDSGEGIEGNWDYHPVYPVWPSVPPPTNWKRDQDKECDNKTIKSSSESVILTAINHL